MVTVAANVGHYYYYLIQTVNFFNSLKLRFVLIEPWYVSVLKLSGGWSEKKTTTKFCIDCLIDIDKSC